ncbi:hypothetical protein [Gimesia maris]|uniref:HTH cro/C1-type domain-containing protein n=1 Tax=Gimesia maris TaxID=122 RepID=A0ABX5YNT4_9PLAN|nr:hypothetical protein [Gimesia maris]EDL62252.1 hypothetical protein PM8797T_28029 [Gimesia maris DSM 8797]QEG17344.1 hypothetical protein GmarT_32240 [Gimesia maris]QGQ29566.1 hypothetical protein F1729_13390 [Gimesia maris]
MSTTTIKLAAGGLLPIKTKADEVTTESIVARSYQHPALNGRPVIRLASERLGEAEDLAMDFLGFEPPEISQAVGVQQRGSLGFAAWALINDPENARFALDLVKQMKGTARRAKSKPGHAWDAYVEIARELGRSARHFLPPYWEEVGRTYKDLGNQTYAARSLNKSLEAERVHALESDRERRRDVVLEFVLSGCLAGKALSEYSQDLSDQYPAEEAFQIFQDLCVRRTRGGMAPWANLPKDFIKLAKAADLDVDTELEQWLEEIVEAPAMGRASMQFWKSCSKHSQRIVARKPAFAIALLQQTKPEADRYYESKTDVWLELLEQWGVLEFLWEDQYQGAPPLGEPIAIWLGRLIGEQVPASNQILEMFRKLIPRLNQEQTPLPLQVSGRYRGRSIDVDLLEAALANGIPVADPVGGCSISFLGWLEIDNAHEFRNQDIVYAGQDERFRAVILNDLDSALIPRPGERVLGGYRITAEHQFFPQAAGDRPGILGLWREHTSEMIDQLEQSGLASFIDISVRLQKTLWPDTLRLFPDLSKRLADFDPTEVIQKTLQAGVIDEYGLPALEQVIEENQLKLELDSYRVHCCSLTFPAIVLNDSTHAYVISGDGRIKKHELRIPANCHVQGIEVVGEDLAVGYRDTSWSDYFYWSSNPEKTYSINFSLGNPREHLSVQMPDGGAFRGNRIVHAGDKQPPMGMRFFHDGDRFWRFTQEFDYETSEYQSKLLEVNPETGAEIRASLPAWFETENKEKTEYLFSELLPAPVGTEHTPLGTQGGMLGWKAVQRSDGTYYGEGIDGRRWDQPLIDGHNGTQAPIGLLKQPGGDAFLPVSAQGDTRGGACCVWDPTGTTVVARLQPFHFGFAAGQSVLLPITFWHLMQPRHMASSRKLRQTSLDQCKKLLQAVNLDLDQIKKELKQKNKKEIQVEELQFPQLHSELTKWLPEAPERLLTGVAGNIAQAAMNIKAFQDNLTDLIESSEKEDFGSTAKEDQAIEAAGISWNLPRTNYYGLHQEGASLKKHLSAVAAFLKGESTGSDLPGCPVIWFTLLNDLALQSWRAYWRAAASNLESKENVEILWIEFLEFWNELNLASLPGKFSIMQGCPAKAKLKQYGGYDVDVEGGASYTLEKGKDQFIVLECLRYNEMPYEILRYSTARTPGKPPGMKVENIRDLKPDLGFEETAEFIQAARKQEGLALPSSSELKTIAERLGVTPAEIALIWLAGLKMDAYANNFMPSEIRKALGLKVTEVSAAKQSLQNMNQDLFNQLCRSLVACNAAAPFAEDHTEAFDSLIETWETSMPRRLPLDAGLQKQLSALAKASTWQRVSHEQLLSLAADPGRDPLLQLLEMRIEYTEDGNVPDLDVFAKKRQITITPDMLKSITQLVGLVHYFTPTGHAARGMMPPLIKQVHKLLNSPKTLIPLRVIYLHNHDEKRKIPTPQEWLNQNLGKGKKDKKYPIYRYDDELISAASCDAIHQVLTAFHPPALSSSAEMNRLLAIENQIIQDEYYSGLQYSLQTVVLLLSPGFKKLEKSILASGYEADQWLQNPLLTAPDVVAEIQKKYKISEDAAVLYAQLLALPDPSTVNLRTWNGWKLALIKNAAAELIDKELVLEAKRARAGRNIFLPGEWTELKAPLLPLETWKIEHLVEPDLEYPVPFPVGVPLVLRPFEELFTAAWQRVKDGDEPRYEEVKRNRKKK